MQERPPPRTPARALADHPDAALLAASAAYQRLDDRGSAAPATVRGAAASEDLRDDAMDECWRALAGTPAATVEGVLAKLRVVFSASDFEAMVAGTYGEPDSPEALLGRAVRDLAEIVDLAHGRPNR